jgi:hypothetical protein
MFVLRSVRVEQAIAGGWKDTKPRKKALGGGGGE